MFEKILIDLEAIFKTIPFLGIGVAFLAGVVVSLSPCIYPLVPITIGVIGAVSVSTRTRGFLLTLVFVLGIASVYTLLGILSSLFGIFLGRIFIHPITYLILSFIFLFLGLSLLDITKFKWPAFNFWSNLDSKKGMTSVFSLGAVSALAIIPCNFPVLGAILTLIATKKNVFYGAAALFAFSLGYGLILLITGTFISMLRKMPKYSKGFIVIKWVAAGILIFMGFYFLSKFVILFI